MEKEKVTTRLDAPLRRRLKVYAAATGLTVEDVMSIALSNYLAATAAELPAFPVATPKNRSAAPAR